MKNGSESGIKIESEININAFKEIFDYFVQNIVSGHPKQSESVENKAEKTADFKKRFSVFLGGENSHFIDRIEDLVLTVRQKDEVLIVFYSIFVVFYHVFPIIFYFLCHFFYNNIYNNKYNYYYIFAFF